MNAVEIEEAVSALAGAPFDRVEFPYAFLAAFGNKDTTIKRLRAGSSNASDVPGGVLQRNNVHIATCAPGEVGATFAALRASPKTAAAKAKFVLATDGDDFQAEDLASGEVVACAYPDFAKHFGVFLPLAGISTVRQIANNPIDIKATGRLNKLYVQLLQDNEDWGTEARRHDLNQFMARLIFCFFAESTGIFLNRLFTETIRQMSDSQSGNTHEVIAELFRAMNTKREDIKTAKLKPWAEQFPYVNGGLFSGPTASPRFSRIARTYLLRAGELVWREINPDIFGSMIQAVADDDERGSLGLHYTSVPNILKVLNPLFLDDLRASLEAAADNVRKLKNLRRRIAAIRVFDPACGSGNFLVIAYKEMREIEAVIVKRLDDDPRSWIKLDNFYGVEIKDFAVEIARLSLLIAEFQCDERLIGQREARLNVLPLHRTGQVHVGNALRIDWLKVCPAAIQMEQPSADLFDSTPEQAEIEFNPRHAETYVCGNPPFSGTRKQTATQKGDLEFVFSKETTQWKNVDYVGAWFLKAALYNQIVPSPFCFVATNSFCQGIQVPITWMLLKRYGLHIRYAYTSFKWSNLATNEAGVTVIVVGLDRKKTGTRLIITDEVQRYVSHINPYLTEHDVEIVTASRVPLSNLDPMDYGVYYSKSEGLMFDYNEYRKLLDVGVPRVFMKKFIGSTQFINGIERYCLWLDDDEVVIASNYGDVKARLSRVKNDRLATTDLAVKRLAAFPHKFRERKGDKGNKIFVPIVSSENRDYFPAGIAEENVIPTNKAFFIANCNLFLLSILLSRLHLVWIATICGRLRSDYSYSNILGWNTFPVLTLTEKNKADLTRCAEDILLAREAHFPATIAELYDPDEMPDDLHHAHARNDETLERIYIGRRFKNDTERLEKLFELYTKMTEGKGADAKTSKKGKAKS